jgi:hypothetical protein
MIKFGYIVYIGRILTIYFFRLPLIERICTRRILQKSIISGSVTFTTKPDVQDIDHIQFETKRLLKSVTGNDSALY